MGLVRMPRVTLGWGVGAASLPLVPSAVPRKPLGSLRGPSFHTRSGRLPQLSLHSLLPILPCPGVPKWLLEAQPSVLSRPNGPCCCAHSPVGGRCQLADR